MYIPKILQETIENYIAKYTSDIEDIFQKEIKSAVRIPGDFLEAFKQNDGSEPKYKTLKDAYDQANHQLSRSVINQLSALKNKEFDFDCKPPIAQKLGKIFAKILDDAKQYGVRDIGDYKIDTPYVATMLPYMEIKGIDYDHQTGILREQFDIGLDNKS